MLKIIEPFIGDHVLIEFFINVTSIKIETIKRRDWCNYSYELLNARLEIVNRNIEIDDVQQYWNVFENLLARYVPEHS